MGDATLVTWYKPAAAEQLTLFPETVGTETARCRHCGQYYRASEEPDLCIGLHLPRVAGCCCGHGDLSRAYVDLDTAWDAASAATAGRWDNEVWSAIISRRRLTGQAALDFLSDHGCGPNGCGPNLIPRSQVHPCPAHSAPRSHAETAWLRVSGVSSVPGFHESCSPGGPVAEVDLRGQN
jgi:hypothetical protein